MRSYVARFGALLFLVAFAHFGGGCVAPSAYTMSDLPFFGINVPYARFVAFTQATAEDNVKLAAARQNPALAPQALQQLQEEHDARFIERIRSALALNPAGAPGFLTALSQEECGRAASLDDSRRLSLQDRQRADEDMRAHYESIVRRVFSENPSMVEAYLGQREKLLSKGRAFRFRMETRRFEASGESVLAAAQAAQAAAPANDQVLWHYRVGAIALRQGKIDLAREQFDAALARTGGLLSAPGSGAQARKLFEEESKKGFVGEPYERVMASFYRGLIYWMDGEPDNARALFRNGEFIDSDTQDKTYAGDWVTLDYLDGLASLRLGGDGQEALTRARASAVSAATAAAPADYDAAANVLVVVEHGPAPKKIAAGEYQEKLTFARGDPYPVAWIWEEAAGLGYFPPAQLPYFRNLSPSVMPAIPALVPVGWTLLEVDGRVVEVPAFDDLYFQAVTRGGRTMDYVLGNKAFYKKAGSGVGDMAMAAGAAGALSSGGSGDNMVVGLGFLAVGATVKAVSRAITTQADVRAWDNLPEKLGAVQLRLAPGEHAARLLFYSRLGRLIEQRTQSFTITVPEAPAQGAARDVVVFRSDVIN